MLLDRWKSPLSRRMRVLRDDQTGRTVAGAAVTMAVLAIGVGSAGVAGLPGTGRPAPDVAALAVPAPAASPPAEPAHAAPGQAQGQVAAAGRPGAAALAVARSFIGRSETEHAALIGAFIVRMTGSSVDVRETPWCAAFVDAVLRATGIAGTGSLSARSYLGFGAGTEAPRPGDIAVFSRGDPGGRAGHVGFYVSEIERSGETYIRVIGGNQNDAVSAQLYPKSRLLGYRSLPATRPGQGA